MDNNTLCWISLGVLIFFTLIIALLMGKNNMPDCVGRSLLETEQILANKSMKLRRKLGSIPPPAQKFMLLGTVASLVKTANPLEFDYILYQLDVPSYPAYEPKTMHNLFEPELKKLQEIQEAIVLQSHEAEQSQRDEEEQLRQERVHLERIQRERVVQEEWSRQDRAREEQERRVQQEKEKSKQNIFGIDTHKERSVKKTQKTNFGW